MLRKESGQLGGRLRRRPPGVMLEVPFGGNDITQKPIELRRFGDQLRIEVTRAPVVENVADVEDDGRGLDQPWRALKRRLVLLIT